MNKWILIILILISLVAITMTIFGILAIIKTPYIYDLLTWNHPTSPVVTNPPATNQQATDQPATNQQATDQPATNQQGTNGQTVSAFEPVFAQWHYNADGMFS